jgi:plasmid replication initiation protein
MKELVIKDNALINASYHLDLVEQRLILLAIIEARERGEGIAEHSVLKVHASAYIRHFNVEKHTAYENLKAASKKLFDRYVTYRDKNPKNGRDRSFHCRWVDKIGYEEQSGLVYLRFTPDVVPLITQLEDNFTRYELEQISQLTSGYAVRLYELLIAWRSTGKTPIHELSHLREQLGLDTHEYKTMGDFKKRVLDLAITQINQYTDLTATYEQHKAGRTITGFSFTFKKKNPKKSPPKKTQHITALRSAVAKV